MIEATPLRHRDLPAVAELFNQATGALPYHWTLDPQSFRDLVLLNDGGPEAVLAISPEGWLVARQGEHTIGFAHCTFGRLLADDPERRRGFLRSLVLLPRTPSGTAVALLAAADAYFRSQSVERVAAFDIRTGYPCYLAGRGVLDGSQMDVMSALGAAGYKFSQRWLLYERVLSGHVPEQYPRVPRLVLKLEEPEPAGFKLAVTNRADPVADLVCRFLPVVSQGTGVATASLHQLSVAAEYRRLGVGSWLLLRCLNELATRGVRRLVVDINHKDEAAQGLMLHLNFEELALSGYSYGK
jgi:ribosomal protein S18 acetylase RimI-like enzyme